MTGFGEATGCKTSGGRSRSRCGTVNNRHFKLSAKISDAYAMFEPALEQLVREKVRRGTVQLSSADRPSAASRKTIAINLVALSSYRDQLKGLRGFDESSLCDLGQLLVLPGVVEDCRSSESAARPGLARDRQGRAGCAREAPDRAGRGRAGDGRRADRAGRGRSMII